MFTFYYTFCDEVRNLHGRRHAGLHAKTLAMYTNAHEFCCKVAVAKHR